MLIDQNLNNPENDRVGVRDSRSLVVPFIDDLPPKSQVFDHWRDRLPKLGILIDWGEPGCWACGFHYDSKYDIKRPDASWEQILKCWDKIPLQRCHVVPGSLGGTNEVGNLFLMCRECHDLAPNSNIPEVFFKWARAQSSLTREAAKICAALNSFGIEAADQNDFCEIIISEEFRTWMSGKCGLHRPQSNYAPRSSRLPPATVIGLAAHYRGGGR
jgi:hypothetical protein